MDHDRITFTVTLDRTAAEALLERLDQRLIVLQRCEQGDGQEARAVAEREKEGLLQVMLELEAALKSKSAVGR